MKIILHSLYAGPRGSFGPGLDDVPDDIATELIKAGVAEAVEKPKRVNAENKSASSSQAKANTKKGEEAKG